MSMQKITKNKDLVSGICITACSIVIYLSTFGIKHLTVSRIGSAFVPRLVAIGLFLVGGTILIQGVRNRSIVAGTTVQKRSVLATFLAILFYVSFLDLLGFLMANTIYLILQFYILIPKENRKIPVILGVALALSIVIYGIFVYAFQLSLPAGILG
ncbi:MAG: tripartite tricarboxylate transporter TctB family protein [Spirochaetes bacterium]|nr:tripartite tricarboxylate transporter TctB family protein [Spirochaetota bacterium]